MSSPRASVVIPTRNRPRELVRAIDSVVAQATPEWELIVVDDASTESLALPDRVLADPRIVVERLDVHAERSAARNHGLGLCTSPAVLFLDDDDELLPCALGLLTAALGRRPDACASVGAVIHEVDGERRRAFFPTRPAAADVRLELLAGWLALGGQSLFRTSLLEEVGGWPEGLSVAEDQDLWLRVCTRGPVALVSAAVLLHRPHGLAGDAAGARDTEREVVRRHLANGPGSRGATRAAAAREHLRDADIAFQLGAYRAALVATVKGIATAPFLLRSPLVGRVIARGLMNALVASTLPRPVTERIRAAIGRRRTR